MVRIKKFWVWLKGLVNKLFHRNTPKSMAKPRHTTIQEEKSRHITPVRLGHNMPKYQPCPNGHGMKKRKEKTLTGAHYHCNKCGDFLVRAYGI
jgi:hypothetical protein